MNPFVIGIASGVAGQHLYEEWIMPTIRRNSAGQVVVGDAPVSVGRPIERRPTIMREPIFRPVTPDPTIEDPGPAPVRGLPAPRAPIFRDGGGRGIFTPGMPPIGGGTPSSGADPGAIVPPPTRRYPGNDPLAILADVLSSMFGAADQFNAEPQYSVVPQVLDKGGGGGNTFLILAVLAAAGFGIYYFYFR